MAVPGIASEWILERYTCGLHECTKIPQTFDLHCSPRHIGVAPHDTEHLLAAAFISISASHEARTIVHRDVQVQTFQLRRSQLWFSLDRY